MVNTFVPDADFTRSAQLLDNIRLNKQRVEANQILNILTDLEILVLVFQLTPTGPISDQIHLIDTTYKQSGFKIDLDGRVAIWRSRTDSEISGRILKIGFCHHPAVRMWYGYRPALKHYINAMITELHQRKMTCTLLPYPVDQFNLIVPPWVGDEAVHQSHRRALLHKEINPKSPTWQNRLPTDQQTWYQTRFPEEIPEYNYVWPGK